MKLISEQNEILSVETVGGKGNHLQKLISWGANVPPFFILTTETYKYFILHNCLPKMVEERLNHFLSKYPKIALRSSMISEDQADASFAGIFETILDVDSTNWKEALHKIYSSLTSDRVKQYVSKKGLNIDLLMAVVVQELVEVEKSGVLFSRSPVDPTSTVAIDAAFGMGEGVVSGHATVDHYQYTRAFDPVLVNIQNEAQVLNIEEVKNLISLALKMERVSGTPCDIEWGIKNQKIFLFQIRPITRDFQPITYLVDTNLSESYPGTVSPFTAEFVKKAYETTFKESAQLMGAKPGKIKVLSEHYADLICCVDDHLYYNLEHYYAVIRALPGGQKNIDNWHKMIGGKVIDQEIPYHPTELSSFETVSSLFTLLRIAVFKEKIFSSFLTKLETTKKQLDKEVQLSNTSAEIIEMINKLINKPVGFGLTVVNDVFIMLGLGFLSKTFKKRSIDEDFLIELLKTNEGVESTEPLKHFNRLISELNPLFLEKFSQCQFSLGVKAYEGIFTELRLQGWEAEIEVLEKFLLNFGDRSFEELKLESLPLKNNPLLFNNLIQWARINPPLDHPTQPKKMQLKLGWFDQKIVSFTRSAVRIRELTRLWRGRYYQILRQLMLNLEVALKQEDESWKKFSTLDLFSISHDEWQLYAQGKIETEELQQLIRNKSSWQTSKKNYPEIIPWVASESLPEFKTQAIEGEITGQGVSSGLVEGVALVLDNPQDALKSDIKDFILVTQNTDPAWVYIMSRSKGLISEKGSLLSHTAIIGRELNIPTIVGLKSATQRIKTGQRLRMNGSSGKVEIL